MIGTTLGLYFNPTVLKILAGYVGSIMVAVMFALLLGAVCSMAAASLIRRRQDHGIFRGDDRRRARDAESRRAALRYIASVTICSLLAIVTAADFGSGMHRATATSPGGIEEMSLTAKNLQLGVPIVTVFHVARMAALVLLIGPMCRFAQKLKRRRSSV